MVTVSAGLVTLAVHILQDVDSQGHKPCGDGYHANGTSVEVETAWSEPLEAPEPRRPKLPFSDKSMDKFGKAVNYADGALSFIECGNAM
ncbi:hypothetical protein CRUP_029449, partial [Coryphaenoides rupestris]